MRSPFTAVVGQELQGSGRPARMSSPAMWPTSGCWRHRVVEDDSPGSVGPLTRDDGSPPGALDRGAIGSRGPQLPPGMRERLAVALHKAEHRAGQARAGHQDGGDRVPDRVETVDDTAVGWGPCGRVRFV